MKEITVQEVQVAYQITGIKPRRSGYGDGRSCGCPVVAIWAAAGCPDARPEEWAAGVYGMWYTQGFINSIDGHDCARHFTGDDLVEYQRGHKDGSAVREAVFA